MDFWDTTLWTLRSHDETQREMAPLMIDALQTWLDIQLAAWADRWYGHILVSDTFAVTVHIWFTATPFVGSHWFVNTPSPCRSCVPAFSLTGTLPVLRGASMDVRLTYAHDRWQASEALLTTWMATLEALVARQRWAPAPSLRPPRRPVTRLIGAPSPSWIRRLAQGVALYGMVRLVFWFFTLPTPPSFTLPESFSVLVFAAAVPWVFLP
ncbi:hypothetical protein [Sulfobacillus sp. hq2]|uniref:hypothetical protein n=1 Tax=Sulfobacillus sp. hq2 TaxID=2039167 RepID=UPI000CD23FC9|nr:hypothetical protein [Sulfobacillus sp. hq2]POB12193.1 hypothetical protein CO251_00775 [Sulfobacillus sp. hq2]